MSAVASAGPVVARGAGYGAAPPAVAGRAPLPSPGLAGPADYQDATLLLMRADVMQSSVDKMFGRAEVERNGQAVKAYRQKEAEAVAQQEKAEKESHGFWAKLKKFAGTVAKVAAVVVAVAGSVFTGGSSLIAAAAIVAAGLSAGAMVVKETHMFGKLSDQIGLGMEIASAVIGVAACGAGAFQAAKAAEQTTTLAKVAKVVTAGAEITGATATATGAAAGVVVAGYQHDADLAAADGEEARGRMQMKESEQQTVIDWLTHVSQLEADETDVTMKTIEGCNQASQIAIAGVRA